MATVCFGVTYIYIKKQTKKKQLVTLLTRCISSPYDWLADEIIPDVSSSEKPNLFQMEKKKKKKSGDVLWASILERVMPTFHSFPKLS